MGNDKATDKAKDAPHDEAHEGAAEKLALDSQRGGTVNIAAGDESKYNVFREKMGDDTDYTFHTQYPNGVRWGHGKFTGHPGGRNYDLEAPPGGSQVTIENGRQVAIDDNTGLKIDKGRAPDGAAEGSTLVKDASGKVVATVDKDWTFHTKTARGEYTETPDGKVSFKPSGAVTDLESLHKTGPVHRSQFEDYGLSARGNVIRFPNGVESSNPRLIPTEHGNFQKDEQTDGEGHLTKVTVRDGNKVLYYEDAKGLHVPTADGEFIQKDGNVTFKSNKPAVQQAALPKVELR